jgi:DNA polymerase III epsilon subunit-like protein
MTTVPADETYVSVDVETAGPYPGEYSLLSIGACLVEEPGQAFYVELQPVNDNAVPEALAVCHLSLEELRARGAPPLDAMAQFAAWVESVTPPGTRPLFVAFNAPFDWMFVNDYFHRFLGQNPFGHHALDMKAYYMGQTGGRWADTSLHRIMAQYGGTRTLTHHALQDALDQAELFRRMLDGRRDA